MLVLTIVEQIVDVSVCGSKPTDLHHCGGHDALREDTKRNLVPLIFEQGRITVSCPSQFAGHHFRRVPQSYGCDGDCSDSRGFNAATMVALAPPYRAIPHPRFHSLSLFLVPLPFLICRPPHCIIGLGHYPSTYLGWPVARFGKSGWSALWVRCRQRDGDRDVLHMGRPCNFLPYT